MPFWDEVFCQVGKDYPEVRHELYHIDALASYLITRPHTFNVVVASNSFGDIFTDISGAIQGSIGIAASANINPEKEYPSMFELVHGSAPDISGQGIANPIGQIWTAKRIDHLGYPLWGDRILSAIEKTLTDGIETRDLEGTKSTPEVTDAILQHIKLA